MRMFAVQSSTGREYVQHTDLLHALTTIRLQHTFGYNCLSLAPPAKFCSLHTGPVTEIEAHEGYQDRFLSFGQLEWHITAWVHYVAARTTWCWQIYPAECFGRTLAQGHNEG